MRKKVKELLSSKLETITGIKPIFNAHEIQRKLSKELLFVRLNSIRRNIDENIDDYEFEVYYARKIVQQLDEMQDYSMAIAEKIIELHGQNDVVVDNSGNEHEITFFVIDESFTEDYSEQVGVLSEARFEIHAYIGNNYSGG